MQIKEHHLDTFGHVNNATYLQILEEARWELLATQGFNLEYIQQHKIGPIILEINIKFLRELGLREEISIETQVLTYEKKVGTLKQNIYNAEKKLCSEAQLTFGLFDMQTRRLILPSLSWLKIFGITNA